ncbi:hypothetical protein [Streptomyces lichenis]|uniref:LPXTG cell wall anchor domain-containing protein n=1 Tax=Streptomyces lichenis TaxID=2306967 RepID=A0ABT0I4G2_9ACTN|nr:hypothetical protein [Streptomyces lichenis]MCK8676213.1 hypothetical protein [Streptomyces lichenis]
MAPRRGSRCAVVIAALALTTCGAGTERPAQARESAGPPAARASGPATGPAAGRAGAGPRTAAEGIRPGDGPGGDADDGGPDRTSGSGPHRTSGSDADSAQHGGTGDGTAPWRRWDPEDGAPWAGGAEPWRGWGPAAGHGRRPTGGPGADRPAPADDTPGPSAAPGRRPPAAPAPVTGSPSASTSPSAAGRGGGGAARPSPSLAGRHAGEGRPRPGRPDPPREEEGREESVRAESETEPEPLRRHRTHGEAVPETESAAVSEPRRTPPAAAYETSTRAAGTTPDRQIPVLTLGVGLAMMGLGLGFLGLRIRRR